MQFVVEKVLPHGLFILAGSGKINKSWLLLDICVDVATGGKLWEFSVQYKMLVCNCENVIRILQRTIVIDYY